MLSGYGWDVAFYPSGKLQACYRWFPDIGLQNRQNKQDPLCTDIVELRPRNKQWWVPDTKRQHHGQSES